MNQNKDIEIVKMMIELYCHKKHKEKELCSDCKSLLEFVKLKRSRCPFGDDKDYCSSCKVKCYKTNKEMQEKIKEVMRFSGPRMLYRHPLLSLSHIKSTIRNRRSN